jgi:hypothetical protein
MLSVCFAGSSGYIAATCSERPEALILRQLIPLAPSQRQPPPKHLGEKMGLSDRVKVQRLNQFLVRSGSIHGWRIGRWLRAGGGAAPGGLPACLTNSAICA